MIRAPLGATDRRSLNSIWNTSVALFEGSIESLLTLTPGLRPGLHSTAIFDGSLSSFFPIGIAYARSSFFPFYFFLFPSLRRKATTRTIQNFCTPVKNMHRWPARAAIIGRTTQHSPAFPVTGTASSAIARNTRRPTLRSARSVTAT